MSPEVVFNPFHWFVWMFFSTLWLALIGIWCQFFRYPDFKKWTPDSFKRRHHRHALWMGVLVLPAFLVQAIGSVLAVGVTFPPVSLFYPLLCLLGLGLTFFFAAPLHARLSESADEEDVDRLLFINAIRTSVWILHAGLSLWWHPIVS